MKTLQKRTLIGSVIFAFICFVLYAIFIFPFIGLGNLCGNTILSTTNIDGTNYKVVIFERDCGATTDFSTQASILEVGEELPDEVGNIFITDTDHGRAPSGKGGGPELRVRVLSIDTIELSCDYRSRIIFSQQEFKHIKIRFSTFGAS